MRTIILCLGNDILGDDGVGIEAARILGETLPPAVDVAVSGEAGLALLELLMGYEKAIIVDSIKTGRFQPGSIVEFGPSDLPSVSAPSPHYAGLPEVMQLARNLHVPFPSEIRIVAMEVEDPFSIREGLSSTATAAMPGLLAAIRTQITEI